MKRWAVMFLALLAAGCGGRESAGRGPAEMRFTVDEKLLAERIADSALGIAFSPPAHWVRVPNNAGGAWRSAAAGLSGAELRYLFTDSAGGGTIAVFLPAAFDVSDSSPTLRAYVAEEKKRNARATVASTLFRSHGCSVHQLMSAGDSLVLFRMIFSAPRMPRPVAFDFSTPQADYRRSVTLIESVAGSVTLLPSSSHQQKESLP